MKPDFNTVFEPVKTRRMFEEVSDKIKRLIFDGTLKPGQHLPPENEIARLFNVGRQSVREALRILELSGFITTRAGVNGGPIIENTIMSRMADLYLDAFRFHRVSLDDFTAARKGIEMSVLDLVLKSASPADLEGMQRSISRAKEKLNDKQSAFEENVDFHRQMAKACKNYLLVITVESVLAVLSNFRARFPAIPIERSKVIINLHEHILDAIINKRADEAKVLLDRDLTQVNTNLAGEWPEDKV
ncbi:MAG: FadR family transcriptional regulator [Desulfobacteraceae bacterium]|nr:MAG: FadR family transcriptional regulator [Desulfobacteraceae bacterium]